MHKSFIRKVNYNFRQMKEEKLEHREVETPRSWNRITDHLTQPDNRLQISNNHSWAKVRKNIPRSGQGSQSQIPGMLYQHIPIGKPCLQQRLQRTCNNKWIIRKNCDEVPKLILESFTLKEWQLFSPEKSVCDLARLLNLTFSGPRITLEN